ncbi:DUF7619 domain-containing protein [Flavobacterium macrobrachii]|uniref:T9SS type A sorting domain-containing protein n=1 Tax=Flavobacterium macrobrachii TaxID=591204 RepID=A0ABS2CX02_9FLAO|nr:T9SS type A sorting domain-containing protein [Flavobacterium macrobrachii]MBM6499487.1 T9SS type A sorting domain-containing protein [Flavobacterium macrobrachii]PZO28187.1 MAG: T9SS C-terminal target domain-containing protein [Flavobacteriaceae bacterium]
MKNSLYILILITGFANAQIVAIPDANFKNKLVNTLCIDTDGDGYGDTDVDSNNDGEIQVSEAEAVLNLNISFPNFTPIAEQISDLTGISSFINLELFDCTNNNLITLDLTGLTSLKTINCLNNHISTLNIIGLTNLEYIYCDYNQISVLNLTGLTNLKSLSCYNNQLSALNLNGLTNLLGLECGKNLITSLNLSPTPNLVVLRCSDNLLNTLNVNFLTNLAELEYGNPGLNSVAINNLVNLRGLFITGGIQNSINLNPLVSLQSLRLTNTNLIQIDASNLPFLNRFYAYNNYSLNYVNIKNGREFNPANGGNGVYLQTNPNLNFICADENNIVYINQELATQNNTTTQVNSYCNFTPGGDYNTIVGQIQFDADNNGCDANDFGSQNVRVNITDGTVQGAAFSKVNGGYTFYSQSLNQELSVSTENPSWFTVSPVLASLSFPDVNNNETVQNFCITPNGIHPDLEIIITPTVPARPGFDAIYKIVYKNKGNQTLSQQYGINFFYNQNLMEYVSASLAPSQMVVGGISWDYANLQPFESREIVFTLNINAPTDTNPVNNDDVLVFTTSIMPQAGDENTSDNTFVLNQVVVGSYDPNDITCLEGDVVSPTEIGEYLHYNIRFENTGTASAENIVVKTEINPDEFDISSLQLLNASHGVDARIRGNIIEFIFQEIYLETGGHGNVLLKVKTKPSLQTGALVKNKANIYFDYNFPIITNDAVTVFQTLSNPDFEIDKSVKIYPNPTNSLVNISGDFNIKSIQLFDVQGRLLQTTLLNDTNATLDLTPKAKGLYFIKVISEAGIKVEKLIKK